MRTPVARQRDGFTHEVEVRGHTVVSDQPASAGGNDRGATPQELLQAALAACTAMTLQMYADRKGWDLSGLEVAVESEPGERGACGAFHVILRLPRGLDAEQVDRLRTIASRCPIHRTLASPEACVVEDRVEFL